MLKLFTTLLLFVSMNAIACADNEPFGINSIPSTTVICKTAYTSHYDSNAKIPKLVSYVLEPSKVNGCSPRSNRFFSDYRVKDGATSSDYIGSSYDKGHMAPADDFGWDAAVEEESFAMTNISPQKPNFNRGVWKTLETAIRIQVMESGQSYLIYTGSIYGSESKTMKNKIIIPDGYYKIAINLETSEVSAWKFDHRENSWAKDLRMYRTTMKQIENDVGFSINLPKHYVEQKNTLSWNNRVKQLYLSKKEKCGS